MQKGQGWLIPAKHDHQFQVGVFKYCGQSGHIIATYPLRPKGGSMPVERELLVNRTSPISLSHLQIPATLHHNQISIPLLALVD